MARAILFAAIAYAAGAAVMTSCNQRQVTFGQAPASWRFEMQEIDRSLKVGYAVLLADVNNDRRADIVVVDTHRVIWFENPHWKMHYILKGETKPDNVCLAAHDIDGDGRLDFALGAGWRPFDTRSEGTLQWLRQTDSPYKPFELYPIDAEPSIHRIRFGDVLGEGKPQLISVPLMGRQATREKNWLDAAVRITAYRIPADPRRDRWLPQLLNASLHVAHNFDLADVDRDSRLDVLVASYEGVTLLRAQSPGTWKSSLLGVGNQENPLSNRGASEVKIGKLKNDQQFIATVEPWHGHQVVIYTPSDKTYEKPWQRRVIDEELRWGHAVWCADLDGDGTDEVILGVRDRLNDKVGPGVRIYQCLDDVGQRWHRTVIEEGGVDCEDLAVGDLDGDKRPDIVAVGRFTGNVRIYWNRMTR
ncbi:MAG: VCBS repeat-containing protein [Gemmatales bacterium]|nr:VCBS repeat-containing protein [Gemmatales bacterium]